MSDKEPYHLSTERNADFPSLDLVFELTKEQIADQWKQVKTLDSKANFILGSATALVSAALTLHNVSSSLRVALLPPYCSPKNGFLYTIPLLMLLLIYFIVLINAYFAYKIREYRQTPEPNQLYRTYLDKEPNVTKAYIFRAMIKVFNENSSRIKNKIRWLKMAFGFLGCEVIVLLLYILTGC